MTCCHLDNLWDAEPCATREGIRRAGILGPIPPSLPPPACSRPLLVEMDRDKRRIINVFNVRTWEKLHVWPLCRAADGRRRPPATTPFIATVRYDGIRLRKLSCLLLRGGIL